MPAARIMTNGWQILRDEFDYSPKLTREQFFGSGFAERKMQLCVDVIQVHEHDGGAQ